MTLSNWGAERTQASEARDVTHAWSAGAPPSRLASLGSAPIGEGLQMARSGTDHCTVLDDGDGVAVRNEERTVDVDGLRLHRQCSAVEVRRRARRGRMGLVAGKFGTGMGGWRHT